MRFIFSLILTSAIFSAPAFAASTVQTTAFLLCEEKGTSPVKVRIAMLGKGAATLILKHTEGQDTDTVLGNAKIGPKETTETALRTIMKVDGVFEWVWIRKPGTPGYTGTLQIFKRIEGWPANSNSLELNCSLDQPVSYFL